MKKAILLTAVVSVLVITQTFTCFGGKTPEQALMPKINKVIDMLREAGPIEKGELKHKDIYPVVESAFDFRILSMLSLGTNWKRFSGNQKNEFTDLFSRLVTKIYLEKVEGQDLQDIKVEYDKTEDVESGANRAEVHTFVYHDSTETPVVYRMILKSGEWKVYDVVIEGVSMVGNYREQYRKKMFESPESLINDLREKIE
ncbi:MAG: MlaC/ttg2D family ABC transporter substrate-binding protein [Thermodesulfobacteriota bacterium]